MRSAIDPVTGQLVHIDNWLIDFRDRPDGLCPVCRGRMYPRAATSPNRAAHFVHHRRSRCPTIEPNGLRFEDLQPSVPDPVARQRLRAEFVRRRYDVFLKCQSMTEVLSVPEFREMVERADGLDVWAYRGLQLYYVPYVLLALKQQFERRAPLRERGFFFVFEPRLQRADALWNQPDTVAQVIWRVETGGDQAVAFNITEEFVVEPHWLRVGLDRFLQ